MYRSFHRIIVTTFYFLQCNTIIHTFVLQEKMIQLMLKSETHWPLKAGYPGLSIKNLNEYVSLFTHCLVNIQNYQGIDIIGIKSPVYLTRFDATLIPCFKLKMSTFRFDITR